MIRRVLARVSSSGCSHAHSVLPPNVHLPRRVFFSTNSIQLDPCVAAGRKEARDVLRRHDDPDRSLEEVLGHLEVIDREGDGEGGGAEGAERLSPEFRPADFPLLCRLKRPGPPVDPGPSKWSNHGQLVIQSDPVWSQDGHGGVRMLMEGGGDSEASRLFRVAAVKLFERGRLGEAFEHAVRAYRLELETSMERFGPDCGGPSGSGCGPAPLSRGLLESLIVLAGPLHPASQEARARLEFLFSTDKWRKVFVFKKSIGTFGGKPRTKKGHPYVWKWKGPEWKPPWANKYTKWNGWQRAEYGWDRSYDATNQFERDEEEEGEIQQSLGKEK
uniref:Uncharacterized protein n=1 Tax=Chromera velia CCMP2878 TaxID=1169474 RepID=A0A0G4FMM5_9ALVE|eukprot:Cvel_17818.t1-p1 / transcript=Cvel_17818.t1 / gene=Cvel_17818 / organism=Chromera_velia_CCMP2878 / gene_product=hypothetical protein / transcript_product=hypothetical protein / location=Cvel_scaffold1443:37655-41831(+) / protein_length=329 / sequence_SO=supercontig / SO=protein_coding / is_pseudo=false